MMTTVAQYGKPFRVPTDQPGELHSPSSDSSATGRKQIDVLTRVGGGHRLRLVKLKLDLHEIYSDGAGIDRALRSIIDEAIAKKAPLVEIIPGKGSGQLKKSVLRFLDRKDIKALYHRVEKDSDNFGRIFVHFRWK